MWMSGRAALSEASAPRVLVVDGEMSHDVFEVLELTEELARVRSPYLFEVGEELSVRVEHDGKTSEMLARVRAHVGPADARVTELELSGAG
jgi:hypothetical protein